MPKEILVCTPKSLPEHRVVEAAARAIRVNPANQPPTTVVSRAMATRGAPQERIAIVVGKRWPASGVRLTVGFMDAPPADLRAKILSH